MNFHDTPIEREEFIKRYLHGRVAPETADAFEAHYLDCDECFEELRASALLMEALEQPIVERRSVGDVVVVDFSAPAQLVAGSREYREFLSTVETAGDKQVIIDLARVSRIDSAGLGLLMRYYSHVVRNNGSFSVTKPTDSVRKVFDVTGVAPLLNISPEAL